MAKATLPIGARELAARRRRTREHVGRQMAVLRMEAGISQVTLAAAAGTDQGHLSRIERGLAIPSIDLLVSIGACLGADLGIRFFPGSGPRLRDRIQAPMVDALIRTLAPRWRPIPELPVPKAHGFVDLAIGLRAGSLGIVCEAHSELRALDEVQRRLREKALAVSDLGVIGSEVSMLLLVRSTVQTRAVARTYEATLSATFPGRVDLALAALRGDGMWPGPTLIWSTVAPGRATILEMPPRGVRVGRYA